MKKRNNDSPPLTQNLRSISLDAMPWETWGTSSMAYVYNDDGYIVAALKRCVDHATVQVRDHHRELSRWTAIRRIPPEYYNDLETFINALLIQERLTS